MREVSLYGDKGVALVDDADYSDVVLHDWYALKAPHTTYAHAYIEGRLVLLHRFLLSPPTDANVDHVDHDGLNCQRSNLRLATTQQNAWNSRPRPGTSKYRGVSWNKASRKWTAQIKHDGKKLHVGTFRFEVEAAAARDDLARELWGDFAYLNLPQRAPGVIPAAYPWPTNAHLLLDVFRLGFVVGRTFDATPGESGLWWNLLRKDESFQSAVDLMLNDGLDFRDLPFADEEFDTVAYDGPYKLNGNPNGLPELSQRYGVEITTRWQDRHALLVAGLRECARIVRPKGYVLVKCQDQVCSGKMRWQTDLMTECGTDLGLDKVDEFLMLGHHIPQPMKGRKQKHAHARPSSLLVFQKQ